MGMVCAAATALVLGHELLLYGKSLLRRLVRPNVCDGRRRQASRTTRRNQRPWALFDGVSEPEMSCFVATIGEVRPETRARCRSTHHSLAVPVIGSFQLIGPGPDTLGPPVILPNVACWRFNMAKMCVNHLALSPGIAEIPPGALK